MPHFLTENRLSIDIVNNVICADDGPISDSEPIVQIDGNDSISPEELSQDEQMIPVIVTFRSIPKEVFSTDPPYERNRDDRGTPVRQKVLCNEKLVKASELPTIVVTNVRSFIPKYESIKTEIKEREIEVYMISEIWEKEENEDFKSKTDKLLKEEGIKYVSAPRLSKKRGGGAALLIDIKKYSVEKVEVPNPNKLEVVFAVIRPKKTKCEVKEIILVSFYYPPKAKKAAKITDYILGVVHSLLSCFPRAGVVVGGDKNDLSIEPILNGIPQLRQTNFELTHKNKTIDIILTNLHSFYEAPIVLPPVQPDNPNLGKPSDHRQVFARPFKGNKNTRTYTTREVRPLPDSGIQKFAQWIIPEGWKEILEEENADLQTEKFTKTIMDKVEEIFPRKTIKTSNHDKPFITAELKNLDRKKKRIYCRQGKSESYLHVKSIYNRKYKEEAKKFLKKNVDDLKRNNPSKAYATTKKLGASVGEENDKSSFSIQSHVEE